MSTATAGELLAEIEATQREVEAEEARSVQLEAESAQAEERQRLRRQLEEKRASLEAKRADNDFESSYRQSVDADRDGAWLRSSTIQPHTEAKIVAAQACGEESMSFGRNISRGEYVWNLRQVSWMLSALQLEGTHRLISDILRVGSYPFSFVYSPNPGPLGVDEAGTVFFGSLAAAACTRARVLIRYRIYVRKQGGEFVQWGPLGERVHDSAYTYYGPDVHMESSPPSAVGIFGLTHTELLQSEWVEDDTLTFKFVLEVLPAEGCLGPAPFGRQVCSKNMDTV